nr:glycosyltransferase family 4 protein [uncultured Psychroserpens sp.]
MAKNQRVNALVKYWDQRPLAWDDMSQAGIQLYFRTSKSKNNIISRVVNKLSGAKQKFYNNTYKNITDLNDYDLAIISLSDSMNRNLPNYTKELQHKGVPYILLVQLATDLRMVTDLVLESLLKSYQGAKLVCFLNGDNAELTQRMLGVTLKNIQYVNNPFNYNQAFVPYTGAKDKYTLACVANLKTFHKGQDLLLTVLGQTKWKSRPVQLQLYGGGVNKILLERLVKTHGLEKQVFFMGYEADKTKIWSQNMVCILPSRMEGQSLAMLEAMSFGRMVISTSVGDAKRLVVDGKTGFIANSYTFNDIDAALERAWAHRENWEAIGVASRDHLNRLINQDPIDEFVGVIENVLKE